MRVTPEELERLSGRMPFMAKQFYKKHKIWPHPAQLYHQAWKEDKE